VWGCDHFLKTFTKEKFALRLDIFHNFLSGPAFEAFNNSKLYEDSAPQNCRIGNKLAEFFAALNETGDSKFWNSHLRSLLEVSCGPVPLFYMARAFFLSSSRCVIEQETLHGLKDFVTFQLKCQEPMIRGAAQSYLLETVLNWTLDVDERKAAPFPGIDMAIVDFFWSFHGPQKVLIRSTPLWDKCCAWIKNLLGSDQDVEKLVQDLAERCGERQHQSGRKIGFFYVILYDAFYETSENVSK